MAQEIEHTTNALSLDTFVTANWKQFLEAMLKYASERKSDEPLSSIISTGLEVFLCYSSSKTASLFLLDNDMLEFHHSISLPRETDDHAKKMFAELIDNGTLGIALSSGMATASGKILSSEGEDTLVIPLTVPSGLIGVVFVTLTILVEQMEQMLLQLFNLHARQFAHLVSTSLLVRNLRQNQSDLEQKVAARTLSLDQSRRELKAILDFVHTGILIIEEANQRIAEANPAAISMLDGDHDSIIGAHTFDFLPTTDHTSLRFDGLSKYYETFESTLRSLKGKIVPILRSTVFVPLGNKEFRIESFIDITERKNAEELLQNLNQTLELKVQERTLELQHLVNHLQEQIAVRYLAEEAVRESEKRFRTLFENSPTAIAITRNSSFLFVNDAFLSMFGLTKDDALKINEASLEDYLVVQGRSSAVLHRINGLSGEEITRSYEASGIRNKDEEFQLFVQIAQIELPEGIADVAFLFDISEQKLVEEEMRKALVAERELGELKSRFVSVVSHEFRTPLTIIRSASQLLEHFGDKWSPTERSDYFNRIRNACDRMTSLLSNTLFIGKAEAGKIYCNPNLIQLFAVCQSIAEDVDLAFGGTKRINFSKEGDDSRAFLDEKLLHIILSNLLSNALKYSPDDSSVVFHVICGESESLFRVSDQGIGMSEQEIRHLFAPFYRSQQVINISGTGLGMFIVKQSVDAHGGTIDVKSEPQKGTTFTVIIPFNNS